MKVLPSLIAVLALCGPATGHCDEAEELKASIVVRCLYHAGEFGNQLVDICVRDDLAAAQALRKYPPSIVDHCAGRVQDDGWSKIKMCADDDMAAETELSRLDSQHASLVGECRTKVGAFGSVKVKACVDGALKSGR